MPEQHMQGQRLQLAHKLLHSHAPRQLPAFLFRHDQALAACELEYPTSSSQEQDADTSVQHESRQVLRPCSDTKEQSVRSMRSTQPGCQAQAV